jgi:hypothetical protein
MKIFQHLRLFCAIACASLASAAEPIDSVVENAVDDIVRFESQAKDLTPARKSSARRIAKLMNLSYERLQTSENKTDASWIAVNNRYVALQEKLENLMNPPAENTTAVPSSATPKSSDSSQAPAAEKELPYAYRETFRSLKGQALAIEGTGNRVDEWVAQYKKQDPVTIPDRAFESFAAMYKDIVDRTKTATERFNKLPSDRSDVQALAAKVNQANQKIRTAQPVFKQLLTAKDAALENVNFDAVTTDVKRLEDIANQYRNLDDKFNHQPEQALALVQGFPGVVKEYDRITKQYAALLKSDLPQAAHLQNRLDWTAGKLKTFNDTALNYESVQQKAAKQMLETAQAHINQGIEQRKPAFFGDDNNADQLIKQVEQRVALMEAMRPGSSKAYRARIDNQRQQIAEARVMLRAELVDNNTGPADTYRGSDRKQLIAKTRAAWSEQYPDDKILAIRMPIREWERIAEWRWSGTRWYKYDRSKLQARVIVPTAGDEATAFPVDLRIDHMKNDNLAVEPWTKKNAPLSWTMKTKNLK